ncbi:unnamed protein product [Ambrosiozyma monospora]|uniref:Unnamed protein product n=1 Tax=Ambrosiozyma monospora TaxID=43982 RepID=A0ACB5SW66_AMBMO|nr:unnamed protein product [Ambrosiozyma monospora]
MTIEAAHICTKECGKLLSCGIHHCEMTCHAGPCSPCLESSSEDLVCHCGKTVVPAPVRCGTKLPLCLNQCQRPTKCGHRPEIHNCHPDDKECPRCTALVEKYCQCEKHNLVKRVMCYQTNVSCGKYCGKLLPCGVHKCTKMCHAPGECMSKCTEKCGKTKKCGHACTQVCHAPKPCNEDIPCKQLVTVKCHCGRVSKHIICSTHEPGAMLECDNECAREQRNKMLFEAFNLPKSKEEVLLSSDYLANFKIVEATYSSFMLNLYVQQKNWCTSIQRIFLQLLSGSMGRNSYHFQPMRPIQRRFIHELAEAYGLFAESQDSEPKRSVFVKVEANSKIPQFKLDEALKISEKNKERERLQSQRAKLVKESKLQEASKEQEKLFNAIAIKDLFFGVTRDELENAIVDIWDNNLYPSVTKATISWVSDNTFVFYPEHYNQKTRKLETELNSLAQLFEAKLKQKSLAYSCFLAKIDSTATVIYEMKSYVSDETLHEKYDEHDGKALKKTVESRQPYFFDEDEDEEDDDVEPVAETVVDSSATYDWY